MASSTIQHATATLPFDAFWSWLQAVSYAVSSAGASVSSCSTSSWYTVPLPLPV